MYRATRCGEYLSMVANDEMSLELLVKSRFKNFDTCLSMPASPVLTIK